MSGRDSQSTLPSEESQRGAAAHAGQKVIAFGCWSNDPHRIGEPGQCGVLHGRVFTSERLAREFYNRDNGRYNCTDGDVIVRVTVEALGDA